MRMQSPNPDACSLAIGSDSIQVDADGLFDVPDVHVDRLVELGWTRDPSPVPAMTLRPDAAAGSVVELEDAPVSPLAPEAPTTREIAADGHLVTDEERAAMAALEAKQAEYAEAIASGLSEAEAHELVYGVEP